MLFRSGMPPIQEDAPQNPAESQDVDDGDWSKSESTRMDVPTRPNVAGGPSNEAGARQAEDYDEFEPDDSEERLAASVKRKATDPVRPPKRAKNPPQPAVATRAYMIRHTLAAEAKKKKEEKKEEVKEGAKAASISMPPPPSAGLSPPPKKGRRLALNAQLFSSE